MEKKKPKVKANLNEEVTKEEENITETLEDEALDSVQGGITPILPPKP